MAKSLFKCLKCGHDDFGYKTEIEWISDGNIETYIFKCKNCGEIFKLRCTNKVDVVGAFNKLREEIKNSIGYKNENK